MLDLERFRRLCEEPLDTARPQVMRGAFASPEKFFGEADLQRLINDPAILRRAGLFRDQKFIGTDEDPKAYTPEGMRRYRSEGVSLTLRGVQRHPGPVRDVCQYLADSGEWPTVHAVAIETHHGVHALEMHWDCNPVLVFQVGGHKRWETFRPVLTADDDFVALWDGLRGGRAFTEQEWSALRADNVYESITLKPGDVYFVPTGWIHRAAAVDDTPSLAVSVCPLPLAVFNKFGNEDHRL